MTNTGPPSWSSPSDRGDHQQKPSKLCCEEIQREEEEGSVKLIKLKLQDTGFIPHVHVKTLR